jgi:hypothetical protein
MESEYKIIAKTQTTPPQDMYDFPITETRYIIVSASDTSKIIDDAQGYGYKTRQTAEKAAWYKFKGGKVRIDSAKQVATKFWKSNPILRDEIENLMFISCKENTKISYKELTEFVKKQHDIDVDPKWFDYM